MLHFLLLLLLSLKVVIGSNSLLFALKQTINIPGLVGIRDVLLNKKLLIPTWSLNSVAELDINELMTLGIKYLVFDKDNTLSLPYGDDIHPLLENKMKEIHDNFDSRIAILSNSAGSSDDIDYKDAKKYENSLGVPVIRHKIKKPGCINEVLLHFSKKNIKNEEICMIGDRLLTDILFGNQNGMKTVLVKPLSIINDHPVAVIIRWFERLFLLPLFRLLNFKFIKKLQK